MGTPASQPEPWLIDHLIRIGRLSADGLSTRLHRRSCGDCGATILCGLDADLAALPIDLDPRLLTPLGEYIALICGAATYTLRSRRTGVSADLRTAGAIAAARPGDRVLASHRCGLRYPAPKLSVRPPAATTADERPPF